MKPRDHLAGGNSERDERSRASGSQGEFDSQCDEAREQIAMTHEAYWDIPATQDANKFFDESFRGN